MAVQYPNMPEVAARDAYLQPDEGIMSLLTSPPTMSQKGEKTGIPINAALQQYQQAMNMLPAMSMLGKMMPQPRPEIDSVRRGIDFGAPGQYGYQNYATPGVNWNDATNMPLQPGEPGYNPNIAPSPPSSGDVYVPYPGQIGPLKR